MKLRYFFMYVAMFIVCFTGCGNASTESPSIPPSSAETPKKEIAKSPETSASTAQSIKWYNYEEGMSLGKNGKKKVFLSFYADWCMYCKEMDKKTFANKDVITYLNENFVSIRVNSDKDTKTASSYRIRGLPDTWFISEAGENIGNQPGFIPPDIMIPLLKFIQTDSYKKMKYSEFLKNK